MMKEVIDKRTKYSREIREKARQQLFSNRRYNSKNPQTHVQDHHTFARKSRSIIDDDNCQIISDIINEEFQLDDLPELIERFETCDSLQLLLQSMVGIRKILEYQKAIGQAQVGFLFLSEREGLQMIFQILSAHQNIQLKYEALQIMKIISYYDDYCSYLLQSINSKALVQILQLNIEEMSLQVITIVGNIALTSCVLFEVAIKSGLLPQTISMIIRLNNPLLYVNSIWLINIYVSKIFQNSETAIKLQIIIQYVCSPTFFQTLFLSDQQSMLNYFWTLNYLSEFLPQAIVPSMIKVDIHLQIIHELNKEKQSTPTSINLIKTTVLTKLLGFISTIQNGDNELLHNNVLQPLSAFIRYDYDHLKYQIYYLLSNLAASSQSQIILHHPILNLIFKFQTYNVSEHLFWFCQNLLVTCQQTYQHHHIMQQMQKNIEKAIERNPALQKQAVTVGKLKP